MQARYCASVQGRFTSVDPLMASAHGASPQTWNRYSYALNNPLRYSDPSGLFPIDIPLSPGAGNPQTSAEEERQRQQQQQQAQQQPPLPTVEPPAPVAPATMPIVDSGPDPLPPGVQPIPTSIEYSLGPTKTYNGQVVTCPDGQQPLGNSPIFGIARVNTAVVRDQGGNIMGPETGVELQEQVRPQNQEAQNLSSSGRLLQTNNGWISPNSAGVFCDSVGRGFSSASDFAQPFDTRSRQDIYVKLDTDRQARLLMQNQVHITNSAVNISLGTVRAYGNH